MIRKCDKKLAWWLELANLCGMLTTDPVAEDLEGEALMDDLRGRPYREPEAPPGFPAGMRRLRLSKQRPLGLDSLLVSSPLGADKCAYSLAQTAQVALGRLASRAYLPAELRDIGMIAHPKATTGAVIMDVLNGHVRVVRFDPLGELWALLNGAKPHIVGCCPVCNRLFERLRKDQKCDTRRCRDTHRKRESRAHREQYEQTRQVNRLVHDGMPLDQAKLAVRMKRRGGEP